MTRVSVVSITYRDMDGLRRTIESVRDQARADDVEVEHIIVDGDSDPRVVAAGEESGAALISEPDRGRYDAMNKGIRAATGDIIWFMHSGDTFASPGAISTVVRSLEDPRKEWGYGMARRLGPDGTLEGFFGYAPFDIRRFSLGGKALPHQACFFGAELVATVPPYSLQHGIGADQLFILEAAKRRPPTVIGEFLCNFDTVGVGSHRGAHGHFRDMRLASKIAGVTFSGHRSLDIAASLFFEAVEATSRLRS